MKLFASILAATLLQESEAQEETPAACVEGDIKIVCLSDLMIELQGI